MHGVSYELSNTGRASDSREQENHNYEASKQIDNKLEITIQRWL